MRIAALASAFNLRLAPHLWAGAPAFFAGLHVVAAAPAGFIVEFSLGANPMIHDLSRAPVRVEGGTIAVPDAPGLGLEMNVDVIERFAKC
jgi:L-alanine-DL-glutamate epimerase-like enolase superfamily enzyme